MLLPRLETHRLIKPADLPATRNDFEVIGAFNPAAIQLDDGSVVLLVRVAETPIEKREGYVASPRYTPGGEQVIDWIPTEGSYTKDPRWVRSEETGCRRLRFTSHLRVVRSVDGVSVSEIGPAVLPNNTYEAFGLEDPRIVKIGDEFLITAVGASWHGVMTGLLSTRDFLNFERRGIAFLRENKDVILFPEKIHGSYVAINRPTGTFEASKPEMWISYSPDLEHWGRHQVLWGDGERMFKHGPDVKQADASWDDGRIGGGVPPIRTDQGWLKIYHAMCRPEPGEAVGVYAAGALLLDLDQPAKVIAKSADAFMRPEHDFEKTGYVNAVVFPTGYAMQGEDILLYYGAADTDVGVVRYRFADLMDSLVQL